METTDTEPPPDGAPPQGADGPTPWEWHVDIPYVGPVGWPLTGSLSYIITVGTLAAFEVISWPVAGLLGLGHLMARNRDSRVASEIGAGLGVAR
ncbi:hypothetical protein [Actinomycetospora chiangmaiensis]|uniref:hypothetical protein n=1 Tax=Actinomycetospora chiangmaiensis TaxID=402650 RepID=UPI00037C165C|nr:hypothetical protein [Actinomycetospora chiangmaiensis]